MPAAGGPRRLAAGGALHVKKRSSLRIAVTGIQAPLDIREPLSQPRIALQTPFDLANRRGHARVVAQLKDLGQLV